MHPMKIILTGKHHQGVVDALMVKQESILQLRLKV
jgi:hypothetical protein